MSIEIGKVCVRVFFDDIKRDRLVLDESDFGKLFTHNIEFVLPIGYNNDGRYKCWVYNFRLQTIIPDNIEARTLYELNSEMENYLKTLGINPQNIKEILKVKK